MSDTVMPETPMSGPFDHLPGETQTEIAAKCNSQACTDAKNAVINTRNDVASACSDIHSFESDRTFWAVLAGVFYGFAGAAVAGALTVGAAVWVSVVLWVVAAVFLGIALGCSWQA